MQKLLSRFLCAIVLCLTALTAHAKECASTTCFTCCSTTCSTDDRARCTSVFIPRSVGDDLVRQATYRNYIYHDDCDNICFGGNFSIEYRFQRSRRNNTIARNLFGGTTLHFQGSAIKAGPNGDPRALIADNFGLSPDTDNVLTFCPRITNNIFDFQLYLDLSKFWDGLFIQINLPLAKSSWDLHMRGPLVSNARTTCSTQCISTCSTSNALPIPSQVPFNPGCMSTVYIPGVNPPVFNIVEPAPTFTKALSGTFLFGDMQTNWIAGHIVPCKQSDTKLASVNLIAGFTLYECPDYHLGAFARAAAPTGTDNNQCCSVINLFSPAIGENHWKLGGGLTGHAELYNCDNDHGVDVYFEGYVETLFEHDQIRSFDFRHKGCLSRYMLLKEFDPVTKLYTGKLINGINFTTRKIKTQINLQGEGQFEFVYSNRCGFSAGIGYNFYGRSDEKFRETCAPCGAILPDTVFGFKGCSAIEGQCYAVTNNAGVVTIDSPLEITATPLNSTESNATIRMCGTVDNGQAVTTALPANPGDTGTVCFASCSFTPAVITPGIQVSGLDTVHDTVVIGTGATAITQPLAVRSGAADTPQPIFINPDQDLDLCSGLLKSQITNKIFGHVDYAWDTCYGTPSVRLGAEVEFASCCDRGAMNAWAIFLDGGIAF